MLMTVWCVKKVTGEPDLLIPPSLLIKALSREGSHRSLYPRKGLEQRSHALETTASLGDSEETIETPYDTEELGVEWRCKRMWLHMGDKKRNGSGNG